MTESLTSFAQTLRGLMVAQPASLRPFVCNGSPLACQIFIVGANPRNSLPDSFWPFWRDDTGFNKHAFLAESYRIKGGKLSQTRERIQRVSDSAAPCSCLETNIWSLPTRREHELSGADRSEDIFEYLLCAIKPKIIYLHGSEPMKHFQRKLTNQLQLAKDSKLEAKLDGRDVILYATKHLRLLTYQQAIKIGTCLKQFSQKAHHT